MGYDIPGHCYYLEDGVEERNSFTRNLGAHIHPINAAGSGGGQQGTNHWASAAFFDPSDAGARAGAVTRRAGGYRTPLGSPADRPTSAQRAAAAARLRLPPP